MGHDTSEHTTERQARSVRQRNGCVTCRQRKKKCDGAYPVCQQCNRLNFTCQREDPRQPPPRVGRPKKIAAVSAQPPAWPTHSACVLIPQTPKLSSFWLEHGSRRDVPSRRVMLRYYTQSFTTLLTTTLENNCFLSVYLPMAMESPLLLDAITAWASTHLSLQDKSYETAAIAHRSAALNSLVTSLGSSNRDPEMELASCLIHCSLESISGDTEQWFRHHVGAYEMIRSMAAIDDTADLDLRCFSTTFEGRWLLRSFAYHDIMMAVAESRKPLLVSGEYWANMGNVGADTYFGLASRIMFLISEISILNVDMADSAGEEKLNGFFSASAFRIEQALISWTCGPSDNEQLVDLAEMYRSAALIYVYRTIRQHRPAFAQAITRKIEPQVVEIVQRVQSLPARCLAESSLLFPMFMAGGEAEDPGHVQVIRQRMLDIINERHFHNMEAVLKVLDEVWHLRATGVSGPGGHRIDWKDVLARRKWMLSIT